MSTKASNLGSSLVMTEAARPAEQTRMIDDPARGLAVWKHVLPPPLLAGEVCLSLPAPASVLNLDWEDGRAVVWLLCAPGAARRDVRLLIAQTHVEGLPAGSRYVGTARNEAGCAYHLFELVECPRAQILDLAA